MRKSSNKIQGKSTLFINDMWNLPDREKSENFINNLRRRAAQYKGVPIVITSSLVSNLNQEIYEKIK